MPPRKESMEIAEKFAELLAVTFLAAVESKFTRGKRRKVRKAGGLKK